MGALLVSEGAVQRGRVGRSDGSMDESRSRHEDEARGLTDSAKAGCHPHSLTRWPLSAMDPTA